MRIAINTRFLLSNKMEGFGWYTYEVVKRMVENHPEHTFIFFFDRAYDEKFVFGDNVIPVILKPQARDPILFKIWFDRSVTKALKKYKADVFFSPDGYLSLKTSVKQIAVIHDINFEHHPEDIPSRSRKYLHKYFPQFARKADHILTVSEYSKRDLVDTYSISPNNITVAWNGASEVFRPLNDEEKLVVRNIYTDGKPFLIFVGAIHPRKNLGRLVTAFKHMKTANPTNQFKLLIVGENLFSSKKHGLTIDAEDQDILFTGHLKIEELAQVMGAASALAFVPYFEGFGIPMVEAMYCGTPILAGNKTSLPEVAGEAAIYCDPFSVDDITDKLHQICNDENLRTSLGTKGLNRSKLFSWNKSAEKAWEVIEKVVIKN